MHDRPQPCDDFQRPWHGHCVDINLEDAWLERLNNLRIFDLINICEGHPKRISSTATRHAHIYLKLKETYLRDLVKDWETIRPTLLKEVLCLFQDGSTHLNFDLNFKVRTGKGRFVYQEGLSLKLRADKPTNSPGLDPTIRAWFENCITCTETFDQILYESLTTMPGLSDDASLKFDIPSG